jgi:hypothetical protein
MAGKKNMGTIDIIQRLAVCLFLTEKADIKNTFMTKENPATMEILQLA